MTLCELITSVSNHQTGIYFTYLGRSHPDRNRWPLVHVDSSHHSMIQPLF